MPDLVIDGAAITSESDLHDAFERHLSFGDHYGRNVAALRDRLLTDVPRPLRIVWTSTGQSREQLGAPLFESVVAVLQEAAQQDLDFGWSDRLEFELH